MDAWDLWQASQTQWRTSIAGLVGLDYCAVRLVAGIMEIPMDGRVLADLQLLERCEIAGKSPLHCGQESMSCRHPDACAMCRRHCSERIGN